jgi:tellurite resistance protein TerC
MDVAGSAWALTLVGLGALLLFDLAIIGRRPHEPSMRECVLWVVFYVALAGLFGLGLWATEGPEYAGQFFAGWVTEYSLSIDNLFVFVIIMARFAVPRSAQQKVLLIGIVLALLMRGLFIALGAAAISRFDWVFYVFGAFLVYTAVRLAAANDGGDSEYKDNVITRWTRRLLPLSDRYNNAHMVIRVGGRRLLTPILVVMIAIGTTDLIFALDSIPAIFGLTQEPYLVFTANVFALMGLRQLYFLLGGLLNRLVYLSIGLSVVLGFIGVKLVLEALHANNVPFINGGRPVSWAPEVSIEVSLAVIIGTLAVTTVASLLKCRRVGRRSLVGAAAPSGIGPGGASQGARVPAAPAPAGPPPDAAAPGTAPPRAVSGDGVDD